MRIGLDTSMVLRLLVGEPADQAAVARQRLAQAHAEGDQVIVIGTVLAETYHALVHHYRLEKDQARQALWRMVHSGTVTAEPPELAAALEPAAGAGVVDRLILHQHRAMQSSTLTFDRALGAAGATRLEHGATERMPPGWNARCLR